jgi:hypothetical protein
MKIQVIKKDTFEYIVIDDFYSVDELAQIKKELIELQTKAIPPSLEVGTAIDFKNNEYQKNNKSLFLDLIFAQDRTQSKCLTLNRKIFNLDIVNEAIKANHYFKHIQYCNKDTTLINYYYDNEEYKPHTDRTLLTAITTFGIGKFEGGDFYFPEFDETIKFKENRMIIFAGCFEHWAKKVTSTNKTSCRISMAQFLCYAD